MTLSKRAQRYLAGKAVELTELRLDRDDNVTDADLRKIARLYPGITSVYLADYGFTHHGIRALVKECRRIIKITLGYCPHLSDEVIEIIANHLPGLEEFEMVGVFDVTDDHLTTLSRLHGLRVLDFNQCDKVTDGGVRTIATLCPDLVVFRMEYCRQLTDKGLGRLAGCLRLEEIELWHCDRITLDGINAFLENSPVKRVTLAYCKNVRVKDLIGPTSCKIVVI